MSVPSTHASSFALDALASDAMPASEAAQLETHLASCADCARRLAEVRANRDQFARVVYPRTVESVRARERSYDARRKLRVWFAPFVFACAAAAVAVFVLRTSAVAPPADNDQLGVKGGPALQIFGERASNVFPVTDGVHLAAGDRIRFVVEPGDLTYLLVASVDGDGAVSIYFPDDSAASGAVDANRRDELPGSIVLDSAHGPERIFALFSKRPIAVDSVRAALAALGAGGASAIRSTTKLAVAGFDGQLSVVIEKDSP